MGSGICTYVCAVCGMPMVDIDDVLLSSDSRKLSHLVSSFGPSANISERENSMCTSTESRRRLPFVENNSVTCRSFARRDM